jgi:5-hydroxyisourate hydrolase
MISTHILDISTGSPAIGVGVGLERKTGQNWSLIHRDTTNSDGRITYPCPYEPGIYRLTFEVAIIDPSRKYHIPLLLSPYGLSTYRGS